MAIYDCDFDARRGKGMPVTIFVAKFREDYLQPFPEQFQIARVILNAISWPHHCDFDTKRAKGILVASLPPPCSPPSITTPTFDVHHDCLSDPNGISTGLYSVACAMLILPLHRFQNRTKTP